VEPVLVILITFALLAAIVRFVGAPLRAAWGGRGGEAVEHADAWPGDEAERETLEAAREAKYREIRDAELDYRTGKLSQTDYEAIDANLRAEAIEILDRLEPLGEELRPRGA
jgi:hypothetical protein